MTDVRRVDASWWVMIVAILVVGLAAVISVRQTILSVPLDATSAEPSGALALSLWLRDLGYHVETASASDPNFETLSPDETVMLVQSGMDLSRADGDRVVSFVRRGGTLVIATDGSYNLHVLRQFGITALPHSGAAPQVVQPILRAPTVDYVQGNAAATLNGTHRDVPVFRSASATVLTSRRAGRGTLWVLGAPAMLENHSIAMGDNGNLAINLVGPNHRRVIFDQHLPSTSGPPTDWLTQTTWGVALLFLIAVALLYRWLAGRRLGPPVIPLSDRHRAASEYVISMAGLLRRAHSRSEILSVYQSKLARLQEREVRLTPGQRTSLNQMLHPISQISEAELVDMTSAMVRLEEELA